MLCNYKPSLYDELGISKNIEDIVGSGTAMIEVIHIHIHIIHIHVIRNIEDIVGSGTAMMEVLHCCWDHDL
jgi:orotate phosphoribosyltransferase